MPNNKSNYHTYSHDDPGVKTMGELVGNSTTTIGAGFDIVKLLNYEDENGVKNIDNLISDYSYDELFQFGALINQLQATSKQETIKTSTVSSNTAGNSTPIPVTVTSQPQDLVTLKPNMSVKLNTELLGFELLYPESLIKLNANQKEFIDKLPNTEVQKLFKKFIFEVKKEGKYIVKLTSSFRTQAEDFHLAQDGNKTFKFNSNVVSEHNAGIAIDINLVSIDRKTEIKSTDSFAVWTATGVPIIATSIGLRWGGNFKTTPYDPIHFDLLPYYNINTNIILNASKQSLVDLGIEDVVNQNSIYADLPLHMGSVINFPLIDIDREVLVTETNQVTNQKQRDQAFHVAS